MLSCLLWDDSASSREFSKSRDFKRKNGGPPSLPENTIFDLNLVRLRVDGD